MSSVKPGYSKRSAGAIDFRQKINPAILDQQPDTQNDPAPPPPVGRLVYTGEGATGFDDPSLVELGRTCEQIVADGQAGVFARVQAYYPPSYPRGDADVVARMNYLAARILYECQTSLLIKSLRAEKAALITRATNAERAANDAIARAQASDRAVADAVASAATAASTAATQLADLQHRFDQMQPTAQTQTIIDLQNQLTQANNQLQSANQQLVVASQQPKGITPTMAIGGAAAAGLLGWFVGGKKA